MTDAERQAVHNLNRAYWQANGFVAPATVTFDADGYTVPRGVKYHFMNKPWSQLTATQKNDFYGEAD